MSKPVFIPRGTKVDPKKVERGYVAHAEGLVRWDKSFTKPNTKAVSTGEKIGDTAEVTYATAPMQQVNFQHVFAPETRAKRSPSTRVDSLGQRIMAQVQQGGPLSEGVFREVQAVAWELGKPISFDDARALAAKYLSRAEKEWEDEQSKHVTRTDPHRTDPGRGA